MLVRYSETGGCNMNIRLPEKAAKIAKGKPFSPVIEIRDFDRIAIMSGQTAQDKNGKLIEGAIKSQTKNTILNCVEKLEMAGYTLEDVFKVDIYMETFKDWKEMNEVYMEMMPDPKPARLALQVKLDPGYLIEIQMWAAK